MNLVDKKERTQATDPTNSYIVQAPAGSGKTEILTQRFLKLLSTVSSPEQIIALTFTRKAANEMRERVVIALQNVVLGIKPSSPHQEETYSYAKSALLHDKKMGWDLLKQPSRLRIITLDSLCQTIANAIPLQENQTPYAKINDNPRELYLKAAKNCLEFAATNSEYNTDLSNILSHIDNYQDNLLNLFCDLLTKREQWLAMLYQAKWQDKVSFEKAIKWIEKHELQRFQKTIPLELANELITLTRKLSLILNIDDELSNWEIFENLTATLAETIAPLLLTSQNNLRKNFDHHIGFKKGCCSDNEYKDIKNRSKELLTKLNELPDFLNALLRIKNLPNPEYDSYQWEILQSLFNLLPILAAHLNLLFNQENSVDFSAISSQALMALGDEENPTNLTLYLDNKIQHILVDEFQDTSIQQYQLLNQLVQGWEENDGRTLFIVGDPMQSIYRFRAAEVGLFLKVRNFGLGEIKLIPLELTCNFRSSPVIVNWVNLNFKNIFPTVNDIRSGAITYAPSTATKFKDEGCYIQALQFENSEDEANALIDLVVKELELYPEDNIAILAKSRKQLTEIMKVIRNRKIPFQGIDIDLLANLPHLRDIHSLTEALLMPANRLAWLSLLRSPFSGLSLNDLHLIASFAKSKSIYYALSRLDEIKDLPNEAYTRVIFIYSVLNDALKNRHQLPLVDWIIETLNKLHINHILTSQEQDDLEQYWKLLEQFEKDGEISNWLLFKEQFNSLYSKKATTSRLQIMTIHKSKGLEFDTVIIPGLGSKSANQDLPLLRWLTLPTDNNKDIFLVSPIKASHEEECDLYNYLSKIDNEKSIYELQRLFYVAVTRAKKRLYLTDNKMTIRAGSFRNLLKNQEFISSKNITNNENQSNQHKIVLNHLPISFYNYIDKNNNKKNLDTYNMPTNTSRLIGIVTHELLQWICNHHPEETSEIPWYLANNRLISYGFSEDNLLSAMQNIQEQINNIYEDPTGRWLLKKHFQEKNEYQLLAKVNDKISTKIIDRTFYENKTRWIIDFKTGRDDKDSEKKYIQQLNEYASLFAKDDKFIKCGLYYLSNNTWLAWDYVMRDDISLARLVL